MSDTNETLIIFNEFKGEVAKGLIDVLTVAAEQGALDGLDRIQSIELTIQMVEEYYSTTATNIKDTYIEAAESKYGVSSRNAQLILSSHQSFVLSANELVEYKNLGLHLSYQVPDDIRLSEVGRKLLAVGGSAIDVYGIWSSLLEGDGTGAIAEGMGMFAGAATASALLIVAGGPVSWASALAIIGLSGVVGAGTSHWFGETEEGRNQIESFLTDFFNFSTSLSNPERQKELAIQNYELNNGELVYPNNAIHLYLLNKLDNALDANKLFSIISASSPIFHQGLEDNLRSLEVLFSDGDKGSIVDSDTYFSRVIDLSLLIGDQPQGSFSVVPNLEKFVAQALEDNSSGMAARYTLLNELPFIFEGNEANFYDAFNVGGALNLDKYSEDYLSDRASMFLAKLQLNNADADGVSSTVTGAERGLYIDLANPDEKIWVADHEVRLNKSFTELQLEQQQHIVFGTDVAEIIEGRNNNDRLFGQGGNDLLIGKGGNDYLEGGLGLDTYRIDYNDETGIERDTIFDNQGDNDLIVQDKSGGDYLTLRGLTLTLISDGSSNYAELDENGDRKNDLLFRLNDDNGLVIKTKNLANQITIEEFIAEDETNKNNNHFGISFDDADVNPPAPQPDIDYEVQALGVGADSLWSDAARRVLFADEDIDWSTKNVRLEGGAIDLIGSFSGLGAA